MHRLPVLLKAEALELHWAGGAWAPTIKVRTTDNQDENRRWGRDEGRA